MKEVDDLLLQNESLAGLAEDLEEVLARCKLHNVTISKKKVALTTTENNHEIPFAGFLIGKDGCKPDPKKVEAISGMEAPGDQKRLRSFLGLANTFSHFIPDLSHTAKPLRALLKKGMAYVWLPSHQEAFEKIKGYLTSDLCLTAYNPDKTTFLVTDASKTGLGYLLLQDHEDLEEVPGESRDTSHSSGGRRRKTSGKGSEAKVNLTKKKLVWCGSAAWSPTQYRYPPIMLELLATVFGMEQCKFYLHGAPTFVHVSDHLPLKAILRRDMRDCPPRLLPLVERTIPFDFETRFIKGSRNLASDCLSRQVNYGDTLDVSDEMIRRIVYESSEQVREDPAMTDILQCAGSDEKYLQAVDACRKRLTKADLKKLPTTHGARQYLSKWDNISVLDDRPDSILLLDLDRIVIPRGAQKDVLKLLHIPHMGITRTRKAASARYYFPNMSGQVTQMVEGCDTCQLFEDSKPEEPQLRPHPQEEKSPMDRIGLDVFHVGSRKFLAMTDYYSSFILIKEMRRTTIDKICTQVDKWISLFSAPSYCRCDGGEFRSTFDKFLAARGIKREQGSSYNSPSQGLIERSLGIVKKMMKQKIHDKEPWQAAQGELNRAPRSDRPSPAQMFFRRWCRSPYLPEIRKTLGPTDLVAAEVARDDSRLATAVVHNTKPARQPFMAGDMALMQNPLTKLWDHEVTIKAVRSSGRSYIVDDGDRLFIRNIRWLKHRKAEVVNVVIAQSGADAARRSCLARRSEQQRFLAGEQSEGERKVVSWAHPLTTTVHFWNDGHAGELLAMPCSVPMRSRK